MFHEIAFGMIFKILHLNILIFKLPFMKTISHKLIVVILFLFCSVNLNAQTTGQWTRTGGPEGGFCNSLAMTSAGIFAATNEGMYLSINQGASWVLTSLPTESFTRLVNYDDTLIAIYNPLGSGDNYSITSFDGGNTWTSPSLIESLGLGSASRFFFLRSGNTIFLTGDEYYYSNNFGSTWTEISSPNNTIYSISCGRDYVLLSDLDASTLHMKKYISSPSVINWQLVDSTYLSSEFVYCDTVIVGQINDTSFNTFCVRSVDNGVTWDTTFQFSGAYSLMDVFIGTGDTLYFYNNALDFYQSVDLGLTWQNIPLPHLWKYQQSIYPPNGTEIALYQQMVVQYFAATDTFQTSFSGMKAHRISMLKSFGNKIYVGHTNGLSVSSDAGISWQPLLQSTTFGYNSIGAMTTIGDTLLVAASDSFYCSTNNGTTWNPAVLISHNSIDAMSVVYHNGKIFLGRSDGILVSSDLGLTWAPDTIFSSGFCTITTYESVWLTKSDSALFAVTNHGVIAHRDDVSQTWIIDTCFNATGAYNGNIITTFDSTVIVRSRYNLLRSDNWGQDFYDLGTSIYPYRIEYVNGVLLGFVGATSIYRSIDRGSTWQLLDSAALPFQSTYQLAILNNQIFCSSYGSSVWKRNGIFNSYAGHVYRDNNYNGIIDANDSTLRNMILYTTPSSWLASTNNTGAFQLTTDVQGDSLKLAVQPYITVTPSGYLLDTITFNNLDFLVNVDTTISDLAIDLESTARIALFRDDIFTMTIRNNGGRKQSGIVTLIVDSAFNYISADRIPFQINGDTLKWQLDTLDFNETTIINVTTHPSFSAMFGDSVRFLSEVTPVYADMFPTDNVSNLNDIIVGAFDPNDKSCQVGDVIEIDSLDGKDFLYTIRFQNVGNIPANDVLVIDTLNAHLDPTTFRILNSSFPVNLEMQSTGVVKFHFIGINLPDSNTNEVQSHGFIKYAIRSKTTTSVGDAITNKADIFFDINPAITTNLVTTVVVNSTVLSTGISFSENQSLIVYPNPAFDFFSIVTPIHTEDISIELYDQTGRMVKKVLNSKTVTTEDLLPGYYLGIVYDKKQRSGSFRSIIIK